MQCPDCSKNLRANQKKCSCGWLVVATTARKPVTIDQRHGWCEWTDGAERCRYPGVWSSATDGKGQRFCIPHSDCHDGHIGAQIVERSIRDCGNSPDYSYEARRAKFMEGIDENAPVASAAHARACLADLKEMLRDAATRKPGRGLSFTLANSPREYIDQDEAA